jgi:CobQ-like glutamine amidotransferase family enzyme
LTIVELRICHLYPDLLNLYGDRGNLIAMVNRARWRGIAASVTECRLGDTLDGAAYDLFFIGGGEDRQQRLASIDLRTRKGGPLHEAAEAGAVVLAVCGGYQLLGHYYRPAEGDDLPGLGLLDLTTIHPGPSARRLIGNIIIRSALLDGATIVGFENHGGRTRLGSGAAPLGRVMRGFGNNGEDHTEGGVTRHVYGTYLHGPLLPKNPLFTDHLIATALHRRHGHVTLAPLDDRIEAEAHASAVLRAAGQ